MLIEIRDHYIHHLIGAVHQELLAYEAHLSEQKMGETPLLLQYRELLEILWEARWRYSQESQESVP